MPKENQNSCKIVPSRNGLTGFSSGQPPAAAYLSSLDLSFQALKQGTDMLDKLKKIAGKAKDAVSSAAVLVGDLNGDGKVDAEDTQIAREWAKKAASSAGDEAVKLGKSAVRSNMAKDAATGAAIGAAIAVPIPVIGPITGAVIGAGIGIYKNLSKKGAAPQTVLESKQQIDVHAELIKLDELRKLKIITELEFEAQKKHILASRS